MTPVSQTGKGSDLQGEGPGVGQHGAGCECVRCRGFEPGNQYGPLEPGNQIATKHGAYSQLRISSRAEQIAEQLRSIVPAGAVADAPTIALLGVVLARVEAADRALGTLDERSADSPLAVYLSGDRDKLERLRQDLRGWVNQALKLSEALGLTPRARAGLGLALKELAPIDLGRLDADEEDQLRRLLAKAAGMGAG